MAPNEELEEITRRLIAERGFSFVAVEGDWPDCFAVNRWVKGRAHHEHTGGPTPSSRRRPPV